MLVVFCLLEALVGRVGFNSLKQKVPKLGEKNNKGVGVCSEPRFFFLVFNQMGVTGGMCASWSFWGELEC